MSLGKSISDFAQYCAGEAARWNGVAGELSSNQSAPGHYLDACARRDVFRFVASSLSNRVEKSLGSSPATGWTRTNPTTEGGYLTCCVGIIQHVVVSKGDWKKRQNPEWLYAGEARVDELKNTWWMPAPEPPVRTDAKCH